MKNIMALALAAVLPLTAHAKTETFAVKPADAKVNWEGKKIIGDAHSGELKLKSGKMMVDGGKLTGGEFVIDMTSLKNTDLTNEAMNQKLVGHLKSDDFFSIDKHPTATIVIKKVEKKEGDTFTVSGDLTIKGKKEPITFPATVHADKNRVHTKANITVDRTLYDVKYNSLKFFSAIGDKAIADTFTVSVDLTAKK
jgi:polyisoprenoid-binding protein YceI